MHPLSACIEMLFVPEHPDDVPARIRAAAAAGFAAVEFWRWRAKDLAGLERALRETGVRLAVFSCEPGGRLVDPATHDAFLAGLDDSLAIAKRLGSPGLIVLSGDALPDVERARQHAAIVAALRRAAPKAEAAGIRLCLEPLNTRVDHVGYFLDTTEEGLDIVEEVASPAVRLLWDLYHSAVMEEDPGEVSAGRVGLVGHVHVADTPGRHEPGTGTVDWRRTIDVLTAGGYAGAIGLEYRPTAGTVVSLTAPDFAPGGPLTLKAG